MKIHSDRKQLLIDDELRKICQEIKKMNKSHNEWNQIESSDMFQSEKYCGGFDAIEQEFCFSYYDEDNIEYWFAFSLNDLDSIIAGKLKYLDLVKAEK